MTWAPNAREAPGSPNGTPGRIVEHAPAQRASGGVVDLLARLADHQEAAAEISRELARILELQLAGSGDPEAAWDAMEPAAKTEPERLIGVREVAARLGVSEPTVRRWRRQGKLPPALDLGSVLRWPEGAIARWLADRLEVEP